MESRGITSALNCSPYVLSTPSEPTIISPYRTDREIILPMSPANAATVDLTREEYELITSNLPLHMGTGTHETVWDYNHRRRAHQILDWLYLGPFTALRDRKFLEEAGITTAIPVRYVPDPNAPSIFNSIGANAITRDLCINVDTIDIRDDTSIPSILPAAVKKINDAVLTHARNHPLHPTVPGGPRHNAKILIVCETGNHRSALIVAAYLTAMFSLSLQSTLMFISSKRFSADLEEAWKRHMVTWGEILQAKRDVNSVGTRTAQSAPTANKRSIDDTYNDDDGQDTMTTGEDRKFVPFADTDEVMV